MASHMIRTIYWACALACLSHCQVLGPRRPLSPRGRAARHAKSPADVLQHRLELVRVDAVGIHYGPNDRVRQHVFERWFAMMPVHGTSRSLLCGLVGE